MGVSLKIGSTATTRCTAFDCLACAGLPEAAREALGRIGRIRMFRAGETVLAESDHIDFVGTVVSGVLRMQKTLPDGRQQIVGLLLPSDMFGRVFAHTSHVAIEAATDVTVCSYSRTAFEALFERFPELEHRMLVSISQELDAAQDWMLLLALQTVTERISTFLLMLRKKSALDGRGADGAVNVPIARRDMAAYLGTTVESISRSVQDLARRGIIRIIDAQTFEICDARRLLDASGHDLSEFGDDLERGRRFG